MHHFPKVGEKKTHTQDLRCSALSSRRYPKTRHSPQNIHQKIFEFHIVQGESTKPKVQRPKGNSPGQVTWVRPNFLHLKHRDINPYLHPRSMLKIRGANGCKPLQISRLYPTQSTDLSRFIQFHQLCHHLSLFCLFKGTLAPQPAHLLTTMGSASHGVLSGF